MGSYRRWRTVLVGLGSAIAEKIGGYRLGKEIVEGSDGWSKNAIVKVPLKLA